MKGSAYLHLIGRVVKKSELRKLGSTDKNVIDLRIVADVNKSKDKKEEGMFVKCVFFGGAADVVAKHVDVGHPLAVSGPMHTEVWGGQNGKAPVTDVVIEVSRFDFLDSKKPDGAESKPASTDDIPF